MRRFRYIKKRFARKRKVVRGKRVYKMWNIFLPGWRKVDWRKIDENL